MTRVPYHRFQSGDVVATNTAAPQIQIPAPNARPIRNEREKTILALARVAPRILPHGDDQIEIESVPQYPWDSSSCPSGLSPFG